MVGCTKEVGAPVNGISGLCPRPDAPETITSHLVLGPVLGHHGNLQRTPPQPGLQDPGCFFKPVRSDAQEYLPPVQPQADEPEHEQDGNLQHHRAVNALEEFLAEVDL